MKYTKYLSLTGTGRLTLGMIVSFLTLSRNFTNPVSQISNQFNSIVTALAGASRIFAFMDEAPETDCAPPFDRAEFRCDHGARPRPDH